MQPQRELMRSHTILLVVINHADQPLAERGRGIVARHLNSVTPVLGIPARRSLTEDVNQIKGHVCDKTCHP
jgi:hypothetical protein